MTKGHWSSFYYYSKVNILSTLLGIYLGISSLLRLCIIEVFKEGSDAREDVLTLCRESLQHAGWRHRPLPPVDRIRPPAASCGQTTSTPASPLLSLPTHSTLYPQSE